MKIKNIIVGASVLLLAACGENDKPIAETNTEVEETTLDETVVSGGITDESIETVASEPHAASESGSESSLLEIVLPQFEDTDIKLYEAEGHSIYSIGKASLFTTGSANLRSGAEQSLEKISNAIAQRNQEGQIMIYTYIDASQNPNYKTDIAQRRTQAIKDWLQNQGNVDEARISIQPIIDVASTAAEDALDREREDRFDIVVRETDI